MPIKNKHLLLPFLIFKHILLLFLLLALSLRMEHSQSKGGTEECHSSESGWTMYIGSTIEDEYDEDDDIIVENDCDTPQADESDDSMASDASSGPSHHHYGNPWENIEEGDQDHHDGDKFFLGNSEANSRTRGNQIAGRPKKEGNETVFIEDDIKGKAPEQNNAKVRRNSRTSKRK